ncbi:MAG: flavodoxin family protein [Spirochaetes bacterium]|nr:flavodoxin family protein [Spirochaetota bacterium]
MRYEKVTVLNGLGAGDGRYEYMLELLMSELRGVSREVSVITLREKKLTHCVGCFGCWLKTPGECVYRDDLEGILKEYIASDMVVVFTPVVFGGYSPEYKKFLDRIIPLIHPNFGFFKKEIHHKPRYDRYPRLVAVGVQDRHDEHEASLFRTLVGRNAINFHTPSFAATVVSPGDGANLGKAFRGLMEREDPYPRKEDLLPLLMGSDPATSSEARAGRALLIVGSPKKGSSTSAVVGGELLDRLSATGWDTDSITLSPRLLRREGHDELFHRIQGADLIVLAFPLYIDSPPFLVTRAIQLLDEENARSGLLAGKRCFVISNNGFPEAYQNGPAVAICRRFAEAGGMRWAGELAIGSGEALCGGRPLRGEEHQGPPADHVIRALDMVADAIIQGRDTMRQVHETMALSPIPILSFPLWRRIFPMLGKKHWLSDARKYGNNPREMRAHPYAL